MIYHFVVILVVFFKYYLDAIQNKSKLVREGTTLEQIGRKTKGENINDRRQSDENKGRS